MFLFLGGFGRRILNIKVKWLSKKIIKEQYPGIIYDHVSLSLILKKRTRDKFNGSSLLYQKRVLLFWPSNIRKKSMQLKAWEYTNKIGLNTPHVS